MGQALAFILGFEIDQRRGAATPREGSSAIGWFVALLVLLAIIKFDHVDLRPHGEHGVTSGAAALSIKEPSGRL